MPCITPPATSLKALLADVDPSIVAYLTKDMLLDSVSDFANFWTATEYERCLQEDVVAHVYVEPSKEVAKVQAARLCAAWSTARGLPRSAPRSESTVGPADAPEAPAGFENVGHFELEKGFMWSKCSPLQDGRILFTPFNHPSVLLYEPASKTWELVGNFSGDCKWSGCAALPSGKVVFVPQYSPVILIFDPKRNTWEEVPVDPAWLVSSEPGSKAPQPKFSDCVALSDGKVLFVPYYHPSIVIFDPATKTCEEVGRFEGKAKWNGCKILPDGRVIFIPFTHPSILIFDPRKRTWEMVGNFEGGFKWSGSELLPDGRVLFAPLKSASILLFNPADKSWEEVGDFGTGMKWNGCKLLPDGRAVFVPLDSKVVLVFDPRSKTFEEIAHGKARRMSTDCAVLPNGRVVFVPCSCHEIVLFSPGSPLKQEATGALELPTATIKKGSEVLEGKTSFVTVAAADNGNLYCAPFSFDSVLVINPATGRSLTLGSLGEVAHKYATMVKHSNGKFYSPPFSAERALEINPAAGTACEIGGSLGAGHAKWECIVEADNGQLYCAPGNSHRVLKIDPATGSVEEFGQPIGDLGGGPSGHYTSIKKASNGKLYSAPLNATQVLMIDPAKGTIQEIGEKLGVGGGSCTPGVPGKGGPDSDKWWAMAQGENGKFYCPPCNGLRVLVIDPSTDEVYKIGPYFAGDSKWGGVAKAPNGKLYSPPRDAERVLMIDPKTDTVSEIGKSFGQGGDKWSSIVLARDGKFYCTPRGAKTILVIDPSTDTAEELPGPVGEGGRWQWMGSVASTDGSVYAPPCMTDRVLCIAPKASGPRRVLVTGSGGKTGSLTLAKMAKRGDLAAVGLARTEASAAQVRAATGAACLVCVKPNLASETRISPMTAAPFRLGILAALTTAGSTAVDAWPSSSSWPAESWPADSTELSAGRLASLAAGAGGPGDVNETATLKSKIARAQEEEKMERMIAELANISAKTKMVRQEVAEAEARLGALQSAGDQRVGPVAVWITELPHQQAIAVLVGIVGLLSIAGPTDFARPFHEIAGSCVGALMVAGCVSFFSTGPSWFGSLRTLLEGKGHIVAYSVWAVMFALGFLRMLFGFNCALWACVDEVELDGTGRVIRSGNALHKPLLRDEV